MPPTGSACHAPGPGLRLAPYCVGKVGSGQRGCWPLNANPESAPRTINDRDVIDAFVAYPRETGYPGLHVDGRPDEDNRGSADMGAQAGPFAIEHTSINMLPNRRRDSDWFMRVAGNLGHELDECRPAV